MFPFPSKEDPWTIYVLNGCTFSERAINFFQERNIEIVYNNEKPNNNKYLRVYVVDVNKKNEFRDQFKDLLKDHKTFPVIFESDTLYGGTNRLIEDFSNPW